jgi:hypothetical protein
MLLENLPEKGKIRFIGFNSGADRSIASAPGFNVASWLASGSIPPPPSSPPPPPSDAPPAKEPLLPQGTQLLKGPESGSWRLVTRGEPGAILQLRDSTNLHDWWWLDEIETFDRGPVIFELFSNDSSGFWRVIRDSGE